MSRELYVDGAAVNEGGLFTGVGDPNDGETCAPFVVFDADQQDNIAGPFDTYGEAETHRLEILAGGSPRLDLTRLREWVERIDEENYSDGLSVPEVAKLFVRS